MKVRSEVVHTYPKYSIDFIKEPFRFPKEVKMFKSSAVYDLWMHKHKFKMSKSRLYDPLRIIDREKLNIFKKRRTDKDLEKQNAKVAHGILRKESWLNLWSY